jgi:predicted DNA-binding transcriptional regulator AlpA
MREVADGLGVSRDTINSYRTRGYMPEPDVVIGGSPGWMLETILWWRPDFELPEDDGGQPD